ncbi:MAG: hypothetical protein JW856_00770, partial [Dehalococcoidales bacterium]|nr:hypothetical protein [Dehalococcoidales bacterium]
KKPFVVSLSNHNGGEYQIALRYFAMLSMTNREVRPMVVRINVSVSGGRAMPAPTALIMIFSFWKSRVVTEESWEWVESGIRLLWQQAKYQPSSVSLCSTASPKGSHSLLERGCR